MPILNFVFSFSLNFTSRLKDLKKKDAIEYRKKTAPRIIEIEINGFITKAPVKSRWARWINDLVLPHAGQGMPATVFKGHKMVIRYRGRNLAARRIMIPNPP